MVRETPVSGALRAWLVVEVLFGLLSILAVFLFPEQTDINFAWPVKPAVMAATLGAFYLAASTVFVAALFVPTWERVRVVILPAAVFTAVELAVTFLHWDRFKLWTAPFNIWFASYVLPPPIFAALYWWQQRRALPVGAGITAPLPEWFRTLCAANGLALLIVFALILVAPGLLVAAGPWMITPLTARALSGWGICLGLLLLSMAAENDWPRVRLGTLMPITLGPALLLQWARFGAEVRWSNPWLIVLLADILLLGGACLALWLNRQPAPAVAGPRTTT
jgi:hypothetical protein